jgi:hypothetical protein
MAICPGTSVIYSAIINTPGMPTTIRVHIALSQLATPHRQSTACPTMELIGHHLYVWDRDLQVSSISLPDKGMGAGRQSTARVVMEYSCTKDTKLWRQDDRAIGHLAMDELEKTGLATINDVLELSVRRGGSAIPAYTPAI